jgi:hypothetical protein
MANIEMNLKLMSAKNGLKLPDIKGIGVPITNPGVDF